MRKVLLLKTKTTPSDPYENLLKKENIKHHFIPLLTHKHLPEKCINLFRADIDSIDYLIITSQRAVEALEQSILPSLDEVVINKILNKPIFTVGPATAEFLKRIGFNDIKGGNDAGNGSILSDLIMAESEEKYKTNKKGIFLVGEIRKDVIPRKLIPNGYNLEEIEVYTTKSMDNIIERFNEKMNLINYKEGEVPYVVFFSPQGTEDIIKTDFTRATIISIGPTTKEYLENNNIKVNGVCKKPNADSLLELLNNL
ncbi:uroporphyrinogen-III synthase [Hanseniaspora uvarum]|nr:uroporphyrinogen-III synthase [Hanseniaspora uvarum]